MTEFLAKPPTRRRGGRPQLRIMYGKPIKDILAVIPSTFAMQSDVNMRALKFLDKLADYLLSDEYAEKSEKNISNKQRWVDKAKGELK